MFIHHNNHATAHITGHAVAFVLVLEAKRKFYDNYYLCGYFNSNEKKSRKYCLLSLHYVFTFESISLSICLSYASTRRPSLSSRPF